LLLEQCVEGDGAGDLADEDHALVELNGVKDVDKLAVLFLLGQLASVLLKALEGQLFLIVDENVLRVEGELLADHSVFLGQGSGKHHHLFFVRGPSENLLYG